MKQFLIIILTPLIFNACNNENDDEVSVDNPTSMDTDAPIIYIPVVPEIVDKRTDFQVSIIDKSSVSSQILINGEKITESLDKNIEFAIDPFEYKTGEKILEIRSKDANSNESILKVELVIKKLLFKDPDPRSFGNDVFLAVNYSNGQLYKSKKIEQDEDGIFYADDDFEWQLFTVTKYSLFKDDDNPIESILIYSYGEIEPGTQLLTDSQQVGLFNLGNLNRNLTQSIEINDVENPKINSFNGVLLDICDFCTPILQFSSEVDFNFFMYSMADGGNPLNDYRYTVIDNINKTSYSLNDFVQPTNFLEIQLPDKPDYFLSLEGYKNEAEYDLNKFNSIFNLSSFTQSSGDNVINVPQFNELFDIYILRYFEYLDNKKTFFSYQKKLNEPIVNSLDVEKNEETVVFTGDYDLTRFRFGSQSSIPNSSISLTWDFNYKKSSAKKIPFNDFVIPDDLQLIFNQKGLMTKPGLMNTSNYSLDVEIYKYEEIVEYENLLFGQSYNQNEAGDVHGIKLDLTN